MLHSALLVYFGCHEVIATRAYYQVGMLVWPHQVLL